jgi:hypothetical protein
MKRIIPFIIIVVLVIFPSTGFSSYQVTLKNGSTLYTNYYWEEEGQVMLYTSGGIMGIKKSLIKKIEETDVVYKEKSTSAEKPEKAPIKVEDTAKPDEVTKAGVAPEGKSEAGEAEVNNDRLMDEFNELKERFDLVGMMRIEELYQLSKDMTAFRDKIIESRLAFNYTDQLVELYSMNDEIEEIINSKNKVIE